LPWHAATRIREGQLVCLEVGEPSCEVQVASKQFRSRARVAEGAERKKLWKQLAEIYPPYNDYQKAATQRTIPVVVLDPVE
jgi:deazaflavin-dependent oxidoreductase (nitroreductase family)